MKLAQDIIVTLVVLALLYALSPTLAVIYGILSAIGIAVVVSEKVAAFIDKHSNTEEGYTFHYTYSCGK